MSWAVCLNTCLHFVLPIRSFVLYNYVQFVVFVFCNYGFHVYVLVFGVGVALFNVEPRGEKKSKTSLVV